MKPTIWLALLAAAAALAACNTVRGVGQDMTAAGHAVSESAEDVRRGM